jgi:hypothetical protein
MAEAEKAASVEACATPVTVDEYAKEYTADPTMYAHIAVAVSPAPLVTVLVVYDQTAVAMSVVLATSPNVPAVSWSALTASHTVLAMRVSAEALVYPTAEP